MAAGQDTGLQVNYKLANGTLINVYAKDADELEGHLIALADKATIITATAAALGADTSPSANLANAKVQLGATEISSDKVCKHGSMSYKEGVSAKGPWKGWMCAAPKGAKDKCQTIWVR
jgi:hypothetical protein